MTLTNQYLFLRIEATSSRTLNPCTFSAGFFSFQTACNKPRTGVRIADIVPGEGAEEGSDILVESGHVPEDYFCRHKQKLSPIGDVSHTLCQAVS